VERAALGGDPVVHLRLGVEGERDAAAAEAAEEVPEEVELQEPVQEHCGEGEGRERVARPRHQRRRAEEQLARRLPVAGDRGSLHRSGGRVRACRNQHGKTAVIEELDLAAAEGAGDGWGNRVREGGGRFDESFATWEAMGGHVSRFVVFCLCPNG